MTINTIVILIILAGVLINISLGNNGLFNKAKTAKEMYTNAQAQEELDIAKMTNSIDSYVGYSRTGGSTINYSTTEQDTGLKWIDGKQIYQKTLTDLNIAMSWVNQNLTQSSELTPLLSNIDRIINVPTVKCEPSSGGYIIMSADLLVKNGKWRLYSIEDYPITEITIQYTKTTDTATN